MRLASKLRDDMMVIDISSVSPGVRNRIWESINTPQTRFFTSTYIEQEIVYATQGRLHLVPQMIYEPSRKSVPVATEITLRRGCASKSIDALHPRVAGRIVSAFDKVLINTATLEIVNETIKSIQE